jgi:FAD:protein FMN transferase
VGEPAFHSATFDAIGVTNQVTVTDRRALAPALAIAEAEVAALDLACSRFRGDSELALLNGSRGRPTTVSPLLLAALQVALGAARDTDGLVDPTVGAAMRGIGYDSDFAVVVARGTHPTFTLVPAAGWRSVQVDAEHARVRLRRGTELDLGATAKAFAADRIAASISASTGSDVLVSLGGDIAVQGAPPGGWPILVTDDHRTAGGCGHTAGGPGQTVAILEGGLATSSTTVRRWRAGRVEAHHIVDPATGAPAAEHWRTISVAAPTCVEANTAATAAIVEGARAVAWLEARGHAARLVAVDGFVVRVGDWPLTDDSQATRRPLPPRSSLMSSNPIENRRHP